LRPGPDLSCVYVAPLKALVGDLHRNLRRAVAQLRDREPAVASIVRLAIRTGDTPARQRRRLLQRPPAILLTTPESLAVLLAQAGARHLFTEVRWLVVDEVHILAGCKRGADLALSMERLEELTGRPLQRIGLSATCAPLCEIAQFLVGTGRPCTVVRVPDRTPLELSVEPLPDDGPGFLAGLVERLTKELERHRTTLIFTNARGLAERLTWALRCRFPQLAPRIAAHHSAL